MASSDSSWDSSRSLRSLMSSPSRLRFDSIWKENSLCRGYSFHFFENRINYLFIFDTLQKAAVFRSRDDFRVVQWGLGDLLGCRLFPQHLRVGQSKQSVERRGRHAHAQSGKSQFRNASSGFSDSLCCGVRARIRDPPGEGGSCPEKLELSKMQPSSRSKNFFICECVSILKSVPLPLMSWLFYTTRRRVGADQQETSEKEKKPAG